MTWTGLDEAAARIAARLRVFLVTWDPLEWHDRRPARATATGDGDGFEVVLYLALDDVLTEARGAEHRERARRLRRVGARRRRALRAGTRRGRLPAARVQRRRARPAVGGRAAAGARAVLGRAEVGRVGADRARRDPGRRAGGVRSGRPGSLARAPGGRSSEPDAGLPGLQRCPLRLPRRDRGRHGTDVCRACRARGCSDRRAHAARLGEQRGGHGRDPRRLVDAQRADLRAFARAAAPAGRGHGPRPHDRARRRRISRATPRWRSGWPAASTGGRSASRNCSGPSGCRRPG